MNELELQANKKEFNNSQDILKDLLQGDPYAFKKLESMNLDMKAIKLALDTLTSRPGLDDKDKYSLLSESWRVAFRDRPPTPEEFLTEKYIGPAAKTIYPRVRNTFLDFMDPTQHARDLILYPHIGWGKSFLSSLIMLYIATTISLMRDPWKYFGLNISTLLAILLISYSIKKSRELLLAPFLNIMGSSPFFEKVNRKETMKQMRAEFANRNGVDKLYYTTADPDSELMFDSGIAIKVASNPQSLLGLSVIAGALSELAFFRDAGKALDLNELIITDSGLKKMGDINIGDRVLSPDGNFIEVINIPWQGKDDLYEIEMEDGRTVRCNANHRWKVTYWDSLNVYHEEVVTTQFMIDHPEIEFNIPEISK